MTNNPILDAIRETYDDLDGWKTRAQQEPAPPAAGSPLADVDTVFAPFRVSEATRMSLVSATEHLQLARTAIESGQAYPSAHFTVLRGALVGASQAIWILSADDLQTRQQRGLTLIAEVYEQLGLYYNEVGRLDLTPEEKTGNDESLTWCRERQEDVQELRVKESDLTPTGFIDIALRKAFADEGLRGAGRLMWRQMGSDAHVLGWAMMQRGSVLSADPVSGQGVGVSADNLDELGDAFVLIHMLLVDGWSRFDELSVGAP